MPVQFLPADVFAVALVFARFGAAIMVLPGVGQQTVPMRMRVILALAISIAVAPIVAPKLPRLPESAWVMAAMVIGESLIGLFIGTLANLMVQAVQTAGAVISLQSNLGAATLFNPLLAQETPLIGTMMASLAVVLIFAADLDHQAYRALVDSYTLFTPGAMPSAEVMAGAVARVAGDTFRLAVQLSAPFLILGILFNVGLGLLARLVPQMQVFFVGLPIQILGTFVVLALTLAAGMALFLDNYAQLFVELRAPSR